MKNKIVSLLAPLLALAAIAFVTACGTPSQNIATGNALAGNVFATWELHKSPANLKGLQDLAAALPDMASGKVTPFQMGVLNAELQNLNAAADANPSQSQALNYIGSLISQATQLNAGITGGNPTAVTAIASAALADFANGINHEIAFCQGQQSVNAPASTTVEATLPVQTLGK